MEAHLKKTVDDLLEKLRGLEKQVADARRLVNSLCELAGESPMFAVVDDAPTLTTIKADTFYGQPFATAAAAYLRMRKAKNMGPATVNDVYDALKQGGYQFDAKNEDYAKRGIRHSLSKNTATFHRVPNGEFGLLEWYPDVKKQKPAKQVGATGEGAVESTDEDFGGDDDEPESLDETEEPIRADGNPAQTEAPPWERTPPPERATPKRVKQTVPPPAPTAGNMKVLFPKPATKTGQ